VFDDKQARKDLKAYRRKGLDHLAGVIVEQLRPHVRGATVLEVGGGVGAIQIELLKAGAVASVNVEISDAYEDAAMDLASASGTSDSVQRVVGDFVAEADSLAAADVVVMNRVVCCYPDMAAMVGAAADKSTKALAMVFPRDRWFMRVVRAAIAGAMRFRRNPFRFYLHDPGHIVATASARGLEEVFSQRTAGWQAVVLERI
jgi:magnesium-protoporphyrin O-methyltransferase